MFRLKHPLRAPHLRAEFLERIVRAIRGFTVFKVVVNNIVDIIHFDQNTITASINVVSTSKALSPRLEHCFIRWKPCSVWFWNLPPASSCEAERSFSALRRIKTWLRSTMTQKRLDNVMMCHIHRELLMTLDPEQIAEHFISGRYSKSSNSLRTSIFGAF